MEDRAVVVYGCQETKKDNMWNGRGKCFDLWPSAFPTSFKVLRKNIVLKNFHKIKWKINKT